ncbi:MAG TPA: hypothetical protein DCQ32_06975 [Cyanobacteria bacterium UBA8156]|nr:hypothetical protein [Cyanobacteria bacterium UBA8156]
MGTLGAIAWGVGLAVAEIKVGQPRGLPPLQTRSRSEPVWHLGMTELQFFAYARDRNWAAIASEELEGMQCHGVVPGGEGLYAPPQGELVYAQGFEAWVCFAGGRWQGMYLRQTGREPGLTLWEWQRLMRAWFPDNVVVAVYQAVPTDPDRRPLASAIGQVPNFYWQAIARNGLPLCRTVIFPSPVPLSQTWDSCKL